MTDAFLCGGLLGDFVHSLYAVKHLCKLRGTRARLYIADTSYGIRRTNSFRFDLTSTYEYCKDLMFEQDYIDDFAILPRGFSESITSVDLWRDAYPYKTWSRLLSDFYNFPISNQYSWIDVKRTDERTSDAILVHRSLTRKTNRFDWGKVLNSGRRVLFVTTNNDLTEYHDFISCFPNRNVEPFNTTSLYDLAAAMRGCKMFIGNQSMPFALASALDVPRICELNPGQDETFYLGETEFTNNLWFEPEVELLK